MDTPWPAAEAWFSSQGWTPFAFQRQVWSAMAGRRSGLLHATTGAGKTYAVWLGALARGPVPWTEAAMRQYLTLGHHAEHGIAGGPMVLALKSGNFGAPTFFADALKLGLELLDGPVLVQRIGRGIVYRAQRPCTVWNGPSSVRGSFRPE